MRYYLFYMVFFEKLNIGYIFVVDKFIIYSKLYYYEKTIDN